MAETIFPTNVYSDIDLAFTRVGPESPYSIALKRDKNAIAQAVRNLILTTPGEKPFLPDFGGGVVNLLFDTITPETVASINSSIRYSLEVYEPRVIFDEVIFDESKLDSNNLMLEIRYFLRNDPATVQSVAIEIERAI
jgi:phage baseplate assembly protein W